MLVEGDDDERFFQQIVKPRFDKAYDSVQTWKYSQEKRERVNALLKSVLAMGADYIFASDLNSSPCVSEVKRKLSDKYFALSEELSDKYFALSEDRVFVVMAEIESWYLAGLNDKACGRMRIPALADTSSLTKEQFNSRIPRAFDSRIDFMLEALKRYDVSTARGKNRSFGYLLEKYKIND